MNKKNRTPTTMVATKSKHKVSCSTPEQRPMSPSSDSMGDSEAASPVPFLCTQDGTEGDTDVVWNFYTPKSDNASSRLKNSTPLSRKHRKPIKMNIIDSPLPKRRIVRTTNPKRTEMFQELIELNQNLHELIAKNTKKGAPKDKNHSGSEEDIFNDSGESQGSPKSGLKTSSRCLRRNVLSSKFSKPDPDTALESDDSMNECLIKASQIVEEKLLDLEPLPPKRSRYDNFKDTQNRGNHLKMDDSMDAILNNIKLDSPIIKKVKKCESPSLKNDSFDSLVGNLNDSALERLTQMPIKETSKRKLNTSSTDWNVQEMVMSPTTNNLFSRHNSMPESPVTETKPSTSGMVFGRYNSMPLKNTEKNTDDSPIRCTPEEIKKKHMLAREKLFAKRQLPFTSSQASQLIQSVPPPKNTQLPPKKTSFQPRVASSNMPRVASSNMPRVASSNMPRVASSNMPRVASCNNIPPNPQKMEPVLQRSTSNVDLKQLIEKKRQEALLKLRRRQPPMPGKLS